MALLALLGGAAFASEARAAEAELAWDLVPEILGYKLYYDVDSGDPYVGTDATQGASPIDVPIGSLADPNAPTFTVTGLNSCEVYYFAVTAYNAEAESVYSGEVSATVLARPEPVVVTGAGVAAMEVSWPPLPSDDEGYIPRYILHWDTTTHADWEMPNDPPYAPPYLGTGSPLYVETTALADPTAPSVEVTTGLADLTTYYVRVQASCDDGRGKFSEETSGMTGEAGTGGSGTGGSGTGNSGTGGSGNTGNSGTGGDGNTGNSGTGATGAAPTGGTGPGASSGSGDSSSAEEEGCGCALPGSGNAGGMTALGVGTLLALGAARRRRRPRDH